MAISFSNVNQIWAYVLAQTLQRLGLKFVIICPGSRSTPLVVAFAQKSPDIEAISILDERSAAFFALGKAKATGYPTAIVCTSGTAAANFYPAVIEAKESRVPLLLLTADRPPQLRDCRSGQTIDQLKLYGNYPNWQTELALPSSDMEMLAYLRQTVIHAWERSQYPTAGAVHLNIPLDDPLAPISDGTDWSHLNSHFHPEDFFAGIANSTTISSSGIAFPEEWQQQQRGIIIAGVAQPYQPQLYCRAIAHLSQTLQFSVLAEGLSPVRNYADLNPHIISTYDTILRSGLAKQLAPEIVIQIGDLPTSPVLRNWLKSTQPRRWIVDNTNQNLDPLHGKTTHLQMSVEELANYNTQSKHNSPYLQLWQEAEAKVRVIVDETLARTEELFEGKAAWLLSKTLPKQTPLFIANSMSVRNVEFFWKPNNLAVQSYFNRGANGIDGSLSTALGIAYHHQSSVMLTGDLALLHDTNGFLIRDKFFGHLTIILINNNGGGIFETLPIANFEPPFEEFFATPQNIDFSQLCATYAVEHELITSWAQLEDRLNPLPTQGIRVLELQTNRKADSRWYKENLDHLILDFRFWIDSTDESTTLVPSKNSGLT